MERIDVVAAIVERDGLFLACRREELDVAVVSGEVFTTVEHGELRIIFVLASLADERPTRSTDHDQVEWLALGELSSVDWADADRAAVEQLVAARDR